MLKILCRTEVQTDSSKNTEQPRAVATEILLRKTT
jgi:hypothetical protein